MSTGENTGDVVLEALGGVDELRQEGATYIQGTMKSLGLRFLHPSPEFSLAVSIGRDSDCRYVVVASLESSDLVCVLSEIRVETAVVRDVRVSDLRTVLAQIRSAFATPSTPQRA